MKMRSRSVDKCLADMCFHGWKSNTDVSPSGESKNWLKVAINDQLQLKFPGTID